MSALPIHFASTLPRSGSTLLLNLLSQNPSVHATPTNDLIEHIVQVRDSWTKHISFRAQGLNKIKPRICGVMRGMLSGFYEEELKAGKIILDKSRGWTAYIELLEEVLQRKVKILVTVRSVPDIVASFEKLHRKSTLTKPTPPKEFFLKSQTVYGRAEEVLSPGGVAGIAISRLRDVFNRGLADRLIIVPYKELTKFPIKTANMVSAALELPPFTYDPVNVAQVTHEDDTVHGMELHTIRSQIKPEEGSAWAGVLPPDLVLDINKAYQDIENLANSHIK